MVYKLVLGDWSKDGHGKCKEVLFDCNYDIHKIRQAYKDSCKKLGIMFSDKDYAGLDIHYSSKRMVWVNYDDGGINDFAFNILNEAGCFRDVDYWGDEEDGYFIDKMDDCARLIMNFIALSMPKDFSYKVVNRECESINGFWNSELNDTFGYGLF